MDDKARERGNREIKESIDEFRKCFAAIDADVTELKGRMEKSKAVSIYRLFERTAALWVAKTAQKVGFLRHFIKVLIFKSC